MNSPIQGTAADIIKLAMVNVAKKLKDGGFDARLVLQVHDELIFEVPEDEVERLTALVKSCMEGAYTLSVPLRVEIETGKSWGEMH